MHCSGSIFCYVPLIFQKYRCVPRIESSADISIDVSIDIVSDILIDASIDISIDMSIDILTDIFIDMLIDISIDMFIGILTAKEEGGGRKEWTYTQHLTTPHRRVGNNKESIYAL